MMGSPERVTIIRATDEILAIFDLLYSIPELRLGTSETSRSFGHT